MTDTTRATRNEANAAKAELEAEGDAELTVDESNARASERIKAAAAAKRGNF